MATLRQILANRANAQKSTGPRSEAGRRTVSANALQHGLAGEGIVLPDEMRRAAEDRKLQWVSRFRLDTPYAEWVFERLIIASVRIDRCDRAEDDERARLAFAAALTWDEDRQAEVEDLGARLARDPARYLAKLRQTLQGSRWLLDRWDSLAAILRDRGTWNDAQRSLALDLLGVPTALRDGPTPLDPPPGSDPKDWLLDRIERETARLRDWQEEVGRECDDLDRSLAERGVGAESARPVAAVIRYRAAANRTFYWAMAELTRLGCLDRDPVPTPPPPRPGPTPAPVPAAIDPALARDPAPTEPRPAAPALAAPPQPGNRRARRAALARARRR